MASCCSLLRRVIWCCYFWDSVHGWMVAGWCIAAARSANRSGWSSSANASPSHSAGATDREPTASPLLVDVRAPASTTPTSTLTATNLPAEHSSGLDTTTTTPARPQSLTALDSASAAAAAAAAFRTSPATDVALQRATKSRSAAGTRAYHILVS